MSQWKFCYKIYSWVWAIIIWTKDAEGGGVNYCLNSTTTHLKVFEVFWVAAVLIN